MGWDEALGPEIGPVSIADAAITARLANRSGHSEANVSGSPPDRGKRLVLHSGRGGTPAPRSLRRNFASVLRGNIVYSACQFGMLAVLAKSTSPTEVGRYAFGLAIAGPIFIFANLKLRQVQVTDAAGEYTFGQYLGQRIVTSAVAMCGVVATAAFLGLPVRTFTTVLAVTVFKALESIIDILYGAMQRREQMHLVGRSQTWRGIGGLIIFSVLVMATKRADVAACGLAAYTVPQIATNFVRVRKIGVDPWPSFSWVRLYQLTRMALPLGVAVSVGSFSVNLPRYFLQGSHGTADVGIYSALAYILVVTSLIMSALADTVAPRMANQFQAGDYLGFRRILRDLVVLAAGIGLIGVSSALIIGVPVVRVVFGAEYARHVSVLVILMAGSATQYVTAFFGTAVNAMRKFSVQMPLEFAAFLVVTIASAILVRRYGMVGAALSVAIGQFVAALLYAILVITVVLPALRAKYATTRRE